ncbi:tRNA (adenosine(37)-N6)-threonylcarbamoyltransferase complex dimerization subunit type 1 TsaB [Alkaliflexus imshenetskii]|uniref:tRNA (adenosine(37)-N6)-threonylcarbamoyltransferase complex dimerization subunit type 1 TsaB n=1 Tax=Alkaliflexus imshenetskii TaxID=286730 RepID=UPI00047A4A15|nr:tRNA (adenosine(37)-N6)-threonylcarbamoyltransferase complex dimerization subunit type 1 TsaB [Alkaliflexus imshenetskii]
MSLILCIETSTSVCSVALSKDGATIASMREDSPNSHSTLLTVLIQRLMETSGYAMSQLNAVAVSGGPGSYTGLRIGVSVAKGICFALGIPLIAIPSLEVMALGVNMETLPQEVELLCPMMDARRMEVYTALFDTDMNPITNTCAEIIDEHSYQHLLEDKKIAFFGNGAGKCMETMRHSNIVYIDNIVPLASQMDKIAFKYFLEAKFENVAYFEPFYLKEFVATTPKNKII